MPVQMEGLTPVDAVPAAEEDIMSFAAWALKHGCTVEWLDSMAIIHEPVGEMGILDSGVPLQGIAA